MGEQSTYSRADIAYELKDCGITHDSIEVSKLVYEAYMYYHQDGAIKASFVSNDGYNTLVDEYMTYEVLSQGNNSELSTYMEDRLAKAENSLNALTLTINSQIETKGGSESNISGILTGTNGVTATQQKAKSLLACYTKLVDSYAESKQDVKNVVCDFVAIREDVLSIYTQYVMCLYDVFGDSIRKVDPQLFDFDQIEFLDVEGMLQNITLKYDELSEHCASLIGEISNNFNVAIRQSIAGYKSMGNSKGLGLAMAGLTMLSHYLDAHQKAVQCKSELEVLKGDMHHDATQIRADYARLALIYKTMNDLYIPKAETFYTYAQKVLSDELHQLLDSIYCDPRTSELMKRRNTLLDESKTLERNIADCKMQIGYYSDEVKAASHFLATKEDEYQLAKSNKPSKPFFLFNLLSFGHLNTTYHRRMYDWKQVYYPVIEEYQNFQEGQELDRQELENHKQALEQNMTKLKRVKMQLHQNKTDMKEALAVSKELRSKMLKHLKPLVELLHIAKGIVESKLDQRYMRTVSIRDWRNNELPEHIVEALHSFTDEVGSELYLPNEEPKDPTEYQMNRCRLTDKQNEVIQQGVQLLESWMQLKLQQEQGQITRKAYNQELKQIQEAFASDMSEIDRQGILLSETIGRIKTAMDDDMLREGLLSLSDGRINLSKEDLDDFLQGKKQIVL